MRLFPADIIDDRPRREYRPFPVLKPDMGSGVSISVCEEVNGSNLASVMLAKLI